MVNSKAEHHLALWTFWLSEASIYQPTYFCSFLPNPCNVGFVHTRNVFCTMQEFRKFVMQNVEDKYKGKV